MQLTQGWARLRNVAIALGLFAGATASARADGIMSDAANGILTYSTSGFLVGTTGVTGTNAITYSAVNNASVDTVSNLPLGEFQVAALGSSQTTTYDNTPFYINLIPAEYNGAALVQLHAAAESPAC